MQQRLAGFGRLLAGAAVVLCAVVFALGLLRDQPVELMIVVAIGLAVAAVPESLPAMVTLALALGARRMAGRQAIVRSARRRASSAATVAACRRAGVVPLLITGDHPLTARATADRLGIASRDAQILGGESIREETAGDLTRARVYARTTPEQKLDIVRAWRTAGHVVAMTGDGVNDGPALRSTDISVAMGRRGTEVARQAADLVLADDDPATIVSAVEEGRRIYANVRRFLLYALAGGSAEIVVMLAGPFIGMPLPLLPAQILWINLLTHSLPGVALGAEPGAPDALRRPPRPPGESILGAGLWPRTLLMGAFIATVTLAAGGWAREAGHPWRSMVFLVLGATQLGVALGSRARPGTLANPFLLTAVGTALGLQAAGVYSSGRTGRRRSALLADGAHPVHSGVESRADQWKPPGPFPRFSGGSWGKRAGQRGVGAFDSQVARRRPHPRLLSRPGVLRALSHSGTTTTDTRADGCRPPDRARRTAAETTASGSGSAWGRARRAPNWSSTAKAPARAERRSGWRMRASARARCSSRRWRSAPG